MKFQIFAIKDTCAEVYLRPIFARSEGEALRIFEDAANASPDQSIVAKHPQHYQLYHIGEWNDSVAQIDWIPPVHRANAIDLVKLPRVEASSPLEPFTEQRSGNGVDAHASE